MKSYSSPQSNCFTEFKRGNTSAMSVLPGRYTTLKSHPCNPNIVWLWFLLRDSFCLSAVSLSRQRHDILYFSSCPLLRVLHVTSEGFGFEFHLRSLFHYLHYIVLTRPNKVETDVHGCLSLPLSLLRSISLASLFSSLSIIG